MTENPGHMNSKKNSIPQPKAGSKKVKQQNHSRQNKNTGSDL